jgi:Flp pilus assembly CpaF family ATPase
MLPEQAAVLQLAVQERRNVLVARGTSPGKTTLVNALPYSKRDGSLRQQ